MSRSSARGAAETRRRDWYWFLGRVGQALIATGVLLFLFVGYQLWGTGIEESQAQNRLQDRFEEALRATPDPQIDPVEEVLTIERGDPVAVIRIPRIGIEKYVVEGVEPDDLKRGPGHYPNSVQPGRLGNFAVAGHRTTYGEPFRNLDQLEAGDEITILDARGREFVYLVTGISIVEPSDSWVVTTSDPTVAVLTLTTCHPEFSAKQRLVVSARLDEKRTSAAADDAFVVASSESVTPPTTVDPSVVQIPDTDIVDDSTIVENVETFDAGWFSDTDAWPDLLVWLIVELALILGLFRISRRLDRRGRIVAWAAGIVPGLVVLYFVFQNVSRLLPPNL
ncbi:MAG: hypothetical protein RL391_137 [Actinomycetota bacterium]